MPSRAARFAAVLIALGSGVAAAGPMLAEEHLGRGRPHLPRAPYPYVLRQNPLDRIPHLHANPHNRPLRMPYPEALHPAPFTPLPQGFTMVVTRAIGDAVREIALDPPIGRPRDIAERLADCWRPARPPDEESREVSMRLSFSRAGEVIGAPAITYSKAGPDPEDKTALRASLLSAVDACTPLRFTDGLGSAIAGLPFAIRFVALRHAPAPSQAQ